MSFTGKVLTIDESIGGFVHAIDNRNLPKNSMVDASRNISIHNGGKEKRGGTAHAFAATTGSKTDQVIGLHGYSQRGGSTFLIAVTSLGEIYSENSTLIKSSYNGVVFPSFVNFLDKVYISNTINQVQTWDGVAGTTSNLTNPSADFATKSPIQLIKHGRNNSERLWAIGVPGFEHNIYVSADFSDDFSTTPLVLNIDSGEKGGLIGGIEFGDRLIVFTRSQAFIINDASLVTSEWGWQSAQWKGGVGSHRLIVRVPNDVICMTDDGDVYSVAAADSYGDYKEASLVRTSFMHRWIQQNVDLTQLSKFHGVYDPELRAVKFFVVRNGQTQVDTALVFYIDAIQSPVNGWTIHDNTNSFSGYSASSSTWFKQPAQTVYKTLTGDYAGQVWALEQAAKSDNSVGYVARLITPFFDMDSPRLTKGFRKGHIVVREEGNFSLSIRIYIDNILRATETILLSTVGAVYGVDLYGTGAYGGGDALIEKDFECRFIGNKVHFDIFSNAANEELFISQLMVDYIELGVRPSNIN